VKFADDMKLSDGSEMKIEKIYPLDATFDTLELIPEEVAKSKRYRSLSGYSIQEVVDAVKSDHGSIDYLVHSLANGPEVTKPLLETSRAGTKTSIAPTLFQQLCPIIISTIKQFRVSCGIFCFSILPC
jgi:enoyl-[acyl-carrier protein] reductase I